MPTRREAIGLVSLVPPLLLLPARAWPDVAQYSVWTPTIRRVTAFAGPDDPEGRIYNHDSSIAEWGGWYFLLWNSSRSVEGARGQTILMKRAHSLEGLASAAAETCFPDIPATDGAQWQPGTCIVGNELWVLWCQTGGAGSGTYFSRLASPTGRFRTERLPQSSLSRSGVVYDSGFVTGDIVMIRLPDGRSRYLAPIIYQSTQTLVALEAMPNRAASRFLRMRKLAGVLINDGDGWRTGGLVTLPDHPWVPWEPYLGIREEGPLHMWVRNLSAVADPGAATLVATSNDHGDTFSALAPAGIEVPSTRGATAFEAGYSRLLVQNDNPVRPGEGLGSQARRNLALWLPFGADFVPGVPISDKADDLSPCYPSVKIESGKVLVSYSTFDRAAAGNASTIKTAEISLPPSGGLILPRANARDYRSPGYEQHPYPHFTYRAYSRISTASRVNALGLSPVSQTLEADVELTSFGTLFDCRGPGQTGWLARLSATVIIGFFGPDKSLHEIDTRVPVVLGTRLRIRISVDVTARQANIAVNEASRRLVLDFAPAALVTAAPAYLGSANPSSALGAISGKVRSIRVWSGSAARGAPSIDFDSEAPEAGTNSPAWLASFTPTGLNDGDVVVLERASREALRITGSASASLVPPGGHPARTYAFAYEAEPVRADDAFICTIGDAVNAVMLVLTPDDRLVLWAIRGGQKAQEFVIGRKPVGSLSSKVVVDIVGQIVTVRHDQAQRSLYCAGRPFFFLGRGWSPAPVKGENAIYVFTDSVCSQA